MKWDQLINIDLRKDFNSAFNGKVHADDDLSEFCNALCEAGKDILSRDISDNPGWFERSKQFLTPFF